MPGLTLTEAEQHLSKWLSADSAAAKGQLHSLDGCTFIRANAPDVRENIRYCQPMMKPAPKVTTIY